MLVVAAVYEGLNELESSDIPLLEKEGWLRHQKKLRSHLYFMLRAAALALRESRIPGKQHAQQNEPNDMKVHISGGFVQAPQKVCTNCRVSNIPLLEKEGWMGGQSNIAQQP